MPAYPDISPLYTDLYQLTMGQSYYFNGIHQKPACFDYFFRKNPFRGGFVVFAGIGELARLLTQLRFQPEDLDFLASRGFKADFLHYLAGFRFRGSIVGMREAEVVFPFEPILRVEGELLETQLIETLLLNFLNFQSLVATKACRIRQSAGPHATLTDFGLRRAQAYGGIQASRAAIIGGFDSTSNVYASRMYDLPFAGTMAHSYIEAFEDELMAFRQYAQDFPDECVLLVDTYNTLKSGIPNAITVGAELAAKGHRLAGIRLDSGDLAYLSKQARNLLDKQGQKGVKIVVSNQLNEYVVKSLMEQKAPIDVFGVGTSLVTGHPDGAIDGVYKLAQADGRPRLKISENKLKTTLPGIKKVVRYLNGEGKFYCDCVALTRENFPDHMVHPFEKEKSLKLDGLEARDLFVCHLQQGELTDSPLHPMQLREALHERLQYLPEEHQRFDNPHIYKVGISEGIVQTRNEILDRHQIGSST